MIETTTETAALMAPVQVQMARQADTDSEVIALWLHGRSRHTQRAYQHDVSRFMKHKKATCQDDLARPAGLQ